MRKSRLDAFLKLFYYNFAMKPLFKMYYVIVFLCFHNDLFLVAYIACFWHSSTNQLLGEWGSFYTDTPDCLWVHSGLIFQFSVQYHSILCFRKNYLKYPDIKIIYSLTSVNNTLWSLLLTWRSADSTFQMTSCDGNES